MAKRRLIEENRERRKEEEVKTKVINIHDNDTLTDQDRSLICEVATAYEYTAGKTSNKVSVVSVRQNQYEHFIDKNQKAQVA
mgnify:CR=1 FL=1